MLIIGRPEQTARATTCVGDQVCQQSIAPPILQNVGIYLVFWGLNAGNDAANEIANITNFSTAIGGWKWHGVTTQYYGKAGSSNPVNINNNTGILMGVWNDTTNAPPPDTAAAASNWTSQYIIPETSRAASHFGIAGNPNSLIVIATGPRSNMPSGYCARHGSVELSGQTVPNAYMDFLSEQSFGGTCGYSQPNGNVAWNSNMVFQHELEEAVTDPFYNMNEPAWYDNSVSEVGDKCQNASVSYSLPYANTIKLLPDTYNPNTFAITPIWSNAIADTGPSGCSYALTKGKVQFYVSNSTGKLMMARYNGAGTFLGTSNWGTPAGKSLYNSVGAASWGPNRLDVFVYTLDNHMWQTWSQDGGNTQQAWTDWGAAPASGIFGGLPSVTSWGPYHYDIFANVGFVSGGNTVGRLYHRVWNLNSDGSVSNPGWESWSNSVALNSSPAAVSILNNRIDVFMVDSNNTIAHAYGSGPASSVSWDNWGAPVGTTLGPDQPTVTQWGPWRYDVFPVSSTGELEHIWWDNGSGGWDSSWGQPPGGWIYQGSSGFSQGTYSLMVDVMASDMNIYERNWTAGDQGWTKQTQITGPRGNVSTVTW